MFFIKRINVLVLAACLLSRLPASAELLNIKSIRSSGLTADQAEQVLLVVLKHERYEMSNPDMWIDPWYYQKNGTKLLGIYYNFGLVFNNPGGLVSTVLGHFAVNTLNGDVWETQSCKRFSFPALSKIQKRISKQTGKSLASEDMVRSELGCD